MFKDAKFTYHKPDKQYHKRNQAAVDEWIKVQTPVVQAALEDDKTVVLVADEMMLSTQTTTQKIWLPEGQYPKIDVASTRKIRCIYGFLNIKTGRQHALKTLRANSQESCAALDHIGNLYKGYHILLFWDNAAWHKSTEIRAFLSTTKHSFRLINFPPYAPDLNPQEHVWKAGRAAASHNHFIENIDTAADHFVRHLNDSTFNYQFL